MIVSGAPATGKATLARLLADRLPLPLLAKDRLREIFAPVLRVDTTDGYRPDLGAIVGVIRSHTAPDDRSPPREEAAGPG